ncbi:serine/threonine-protein kinase HT1-like [Durio zibethinus]|uniref:Serine/threonine-protein kinase HT1-like n=1 Tax=Durio zibethinus TaxID=66656 RepID=A0A6P6BEP2_DURZI|nr:serine/threonine-protein kinase HT1-like [Durio zibethinus]
MEQEMGEMDEGEGWTITRTIKKKDLKKMDEQLDLLWAMGELKEREKVEKGLLSNSNSNQEEWEINPNNIIFKALVSKGTSVEIFRGFYDDQDVTVKVFDWREKIQNPNNLPMIMSLFKEEISFWYTIDHPNIIKLIGAKIDEPEIILRGDNHEIRVFSNMTYVVVEYLSGGTLKSFLSKNRENKLALKTVIHLALHLARGLAYLHSWKLIHGNVKPENMLLDKNFKLKITDFGTCNVEISSHEEVTSDSATDTISYMAPEVINSKPYDRKCDVYSFGICLWEIYCCDMPYPNIGFSELTSAILYENMRPEIPKHCPEALANLMKQCWDTDPSKRPEMEEVVWMLEAIDTSKGKKVKWLDVQSCFCIRK